ASSAGRSLPGRVRTTSLRSWTVEGYGVWGGGYGGWGRGRGRRSRGGSATPLPFIPPRGIWWGRCGRRSECSMTMDSQQVPALELIDLRSEEHTSELQSRFDLVCRLLLEKK